MTRYALVTRHPDDCRELQARLGPAGWVVRPYPVLRLEDVDDEAAWRALSDWDRAVLADAWLALASPRAPDRFVHQATAHGVSHLTALPVAAVGQTTAAAAVKAGLMVELVGPGTGQELAGQLLARLDQGSRIVFASGRERRPELPRALAAAGHTVQSVVVYRMRPTPPRELPPLGPSLDAVVLTSPRAARYYLEGVGGRPLPCPHWALGPTTRDAAAALGIDCRIPPETTLESLAEELCRS